MSSASKPKTPHTKVDRPTTDGEGDEEVTVVPVPLLDDNYSYVLLHKASRTAALVDPADPYPVVKLMQEQYSDYQIHTILTTHKHCQCDCSTETARMQRISQSFSRPVSQPGWFGIRRLHC